AFRHAPLPASVSTSPCQQTRPASGRRSPTSTCSSVVLPLPLSPVRTTHSPARTAMLAPSRIVLDPYRLLISEPSIMVPTPPPGGGRSGAGGGCAVCLVLARERAPTR